MIPNHIVKSVIKTISKLKVERSFADTIQLKLNAFSFNLVLLADV